MTWWDFRRYAPLGKTVLSGLLSVTTVGLLTPQPIPRAWAVESVADEPTADGMPQEDDDDSRSLCWEGAPLLGGEELVSGTREHAACYRSGELHVSWRGMDVAGQCRVSLELNEESFDLKTVGSMNEQSVYEACFVLEDGLYNRLVLHVDDTGGNTLESTFEHVLVTTRQPRYRALWDMAGDGCVVDDTTYYSDHRTLTIAVEDPCPGDDLSIVANGERIVAQKTEDVQTYTLECVCDGRYEVDLEGADELGRVPDRASDGLPLPMSFVVDTAPPTVRVLYDGAELPDDSLHEGRLYVSSRPRVTVEVCDENLDLSSLRVAGRAFETWECKGNSAFLDLPDDMPLDEPLRVTGSDLAGNMLPDGEWVVPVVIDKEAPLVEVVEPMSPTTSATSSEGTVLFFAGESSVELHVSDNEGLASIEVEPGDACSVSPEHILPGTSSERISLRLLEGKELGRDVTVRVCDLAGNWCTWSIDMWGETSEVGESRPSQNAAVYQDDTGAPIFPIFLLSDTTPPEVRVEGVEDGSVYDECPLVRVSVDEKSFEHLAAYEGLAFSDQCVLAMFEGGLHGEDSTIREGASLYVRDFTPNALTGRWEATTRVPKEGAYALRAQLVDVAGNASALWGCHVVVDTTPPACRVTFVRDDMHTEEHEGEFYRAPRKAIVRIQERNWDDLRRLEVRAVSEDGTARTIGANDFWAEGDGWHVCEVEFAHEGEHRLLCDATDVAGNVMDPWHGSSFVVDLTDPVVEVTYDGEELTKDRFARTSRTATIKVVERNWGGDGSCTVEVATGNAVPSSVPQPSAWRVRDSTRPDEHVCTVAFDRDGAYVLRVNGHDRAMRTLRCGGNEGFVDEFVVDTQAPTVSVGFPPSSYTEHDGIMYLNHAVEVPICVKDRNFDAHRSTLGWDGASQACDRTDEWQIDESDQTGIVARTRTLRYGHGFHTSPSVLAKDLAGNETEEAGRPVVVDLEAPKLVSVSSTAMPAAAYDCETPEGKEELQVFDRPTQLVFEVEDQYLLDGASLYDPDGQYHLEQNVERGSAKGRAVVSLVDGMGSHEGESYGRDVVFSVTDIAGNRHSWTLNRQGNVVADTVSRGIEPGLNGMDANLIALMQDTIAPTIEVKGIEPGVVTNQTQVADVNIHEFNFSFLRLLRPNDVAVRIMCRDATPEGRSHVEEVAVSKFEGTDPVWSMAKEFAVDGHYAMEAFFTDVAGHPSNRVQLGEFTVDKTPPVIEVSWDHGIDEARTHGGRHYYATTRSATIVVHEHNFRPEDVTIDAGPEGVVGPWNELGDDRHTCTVTYTHEAKDCHLVVGAKDQAGNEAHAYEQRGFVIDLTPPTAQVLNVEGSHGERAFAKDIEPTILFDDGDQGNFDMGSQGWSYRIQGMRAENVAERGDLHRFSQTERTSDTGVNVTFGEFGVLDEASGTYDVGYDDVYTITAWAKDLAGNESQPVSATFSVNRFGSNFFVEDAKKLCAANQMSGDESEGMVPLPEAPQIVVHEVNVSGSQSASDHRVLRDYANAVEELTQDAYGEQRSSFEGGYHLQALTEPSAYNEHAGWSEYVYTIRKGNFGKGALGRGDGQGRYRINVSSVDEAHNSNTTSRYWSSDRVRDKAADKSATVTFTLDELAPTIEHLDVGSGVTLGREYLASFRVTDDISCGDSLEVLVDGEAVDVYAAGSERVINAHDVGSGTYEFVIPARSFAPHVISVRVTDYAGRSVSQHTSALVTTFVPEIALVLGLPAAGAFVVAVVVRHKRAAEPKYPHAV